MLFQEVRLVKHLIMLKTFTRIKNVLLDGSLEVDNNAAERAIKPFVIGRKNFLLQTLLKVQLQVAIFIALLKLPRLIN